MLGAIAFFPSADLGISTLSLMGFLLSLGILVDDAIVVERIRTHESHPRQPRGGGQRHN